MRIVDPETSRTHLIDTASKKVRIAWKQLAAERTIAIEQSLRRCNVDEIHIKTGEPFAQSLRQFFKRREAKRIA
jgi:hypothetical protein